MAKCYFSALWFAKKPYYVTATNDIVPRVNGPEFLFMRRRSRICLDRLISLPQSCSLIALDMQTSLQDKFFLKLSQWLWSHTFLHRRWLLTFESYNRSQLGLIHFGAGLFHFQTVSSTSGNKLIAFLDKMFLFLVLCSKRYFHAKPHKWVMKDFGHAVIMMIMNEYNFLR